MSKFKRYERYKDSGVEWIGEIPEHWEIKKIKYISNITMGQSPKSEECSLDETGLPFLQGNAEFTSLHPIPKIYCNTANKFSKVNDILLSVRAPVGAMNISDRVYGIGRGLCAITANKVQVRYLWYSMNVSLEELFIKSKGSTFEAVTVTDVNNLLSILPPKNEQIAIANFLDQKTAEIDGLIADKEKLIELLQEKRQAIITEAVTKGLNPSVKMKDSGIEWIGEIPEHWEVKKLKYVSNITMGQSPKSEECSYDEIGVPFLQGNAEFTNVHPIPKLYCNTANKFSKVNDILLSVRAPVGAMNISDRVYGIGRGLCAITAKKIQVKYLWYSLTVSLEELFIKSKGSTFEAVTVTDVQNLLIILPPKNEQDAIVNFLDQKTAEIDSLVTETKNQIEKLKEYRQSLISEAVTGKIDVREFQNKNEVIFRNE